MKSIEQIQLRWGPRRVPLQAVAVIARGMPARELASSTISHLKRNVSTLRGVIVDNDLLLVMGDSDNLPWADGAVYLGQEEGANILTSTTMQPSVPAALLEQAFKHQFPQLSTPYAVLHDPATIVPLANAISIQPEILERWLAN